MKNKIHEGNKLFIPITSIHTAQEIKRIMDSMLIQNNDLLEELIVAEIGFKIEKDGFVFIDKKVAHKNGTVDFLEFYFYKEIEAWIENPTNKVPAIQYDFTRIEKERGGNRKRVISRTSIREPFIILKDVNLWAQIGKEKVPTQRKENNSC